MKSLNKYINESIDNNLFWKIDHYFKTKPQERRDFYSIIDYCRENTVSNSKQLEEYLKEHPFENLKKFVDFIDDVIKQDTSGRDYVYILYKIITLIIGNQSKGIKYTNKKGVA